MSIVKAIENIELERENNKALREAMRGRMETLMLSVDALYAQAQAQAQHLQMLKEDLVKARVAMMQEMEDRDEALRVIIEGES
jgi:hypothetical protein